MEFLDSLTSASQQLRGLAIFISTFGAFLIILGIAFIFTSDCHPDKTDPSRLENVIGYFSVLVIYLASVVWTTKNAFLRVLDFTPEDRD